MKAMLDNFYRFFQRSFSTPPRIGGRCTGRFYALNALENRVYDIEMEEARTSSSNLPPRPLEPRHDSGRARFSEGPRRSEIPVVCPLTDDKGQSISKLAK